MVAPGKSASCAWGHSWGSSHGEAASLCLLLSGKAAQAESVAGVSPPPLLPPPPEEGPWAAEFPPFGLVVCEGGVGRP